MLKSMTGFGRGEYDSDKFSLKVEIKSINSRYNEINVHLPRFLSVFEDRIRKEVMKSVSRGKTEVFVTGNFSMSDILELKVDEQLASAYHEAFTDLCDVVGADMSKFSPEREVYFLAKLPDVVSLQEGDWDEEKIWPVVQQTVCQAVTALVQMRTTEGGNIETDFNLHLNLLEKMVLQIEAYSPQVVREYQTKIHQRLTDLLETEKIKLDPDRILQEVAIFADKVSVTEEIVRLKSHILQFRSIMQKPEPVGRKLDFLIQEFNREANTIGSKVNDYKLSGLVVDMKSEIEKIREQIQNVE